MDLFYRLHVSALTDESGMILTVHKSSSSLTPSGGFVFCSGDEKVDLLIGVQHLSGSLRSGDGGQFVGVEPGVEGGAGPAGLLPLTSRRQHVTHLAVEAGEGGQPVKYQVLDPFDGVPERDKNKIVLEQFIKCI